MAKLDEPGQPVEQAFNRRRNAERDIAELIGICKGTIADGIVNRAEFDFLRAWTRIHASLVDVHPYREIATRLERIYQDGRMEEAELQDLRALLALVTGWSANPSNAEARSSRIAFNEPPPRISFPERMFCVTGRFAFGPRESVVAEILARGGRSYPNPTLKTDYLVVGTFASRDWISADYGRKIDKAIAIRKNPKGHIAIVSEEHWINMLQS